MTVATRRRGRSIGFWLAVVAGLALVALVLGPPGGDGDPLDARSTGRLGARGLVLLLEELGADVTIGQRLPGDSTDVALVLDRRLGQRQDERLARWVRGGGVLVVADPDSPLHVAEPGDVIASGVFDDSVDRGVCDLDALAGAVRIDVGGGALFQREPGVAGCFGDDEQAVVVAAPDGEGTVVSVGAPSLFVNERLADESNAVVAAALLAPVPGTAIAIVERAAPGEGDEDLFDLVPDNVISALLQLGVAFGLYALWRARRLGRPVREVQPAQIEGSELVLAVRNLLQRAKDPERAAGVLRRDLHRRLSERLGIPSGAPADQVADGAAARTGLARERLLAALAGPPVRNEAALVALAREIDAIRQEALDGR